jgi:hypothetical protein
MDDIQPQITEPGVEPVEQPSDTAPTGTTEKLLPQSQVNALIAQARREGAASATKKVAPAPAAPSNPAPVAPASAPDQIASMAARLEEMEMRGRFDRIAIKAGLDDSQADDMFVLFKAQRPQDPQAWLGEKSKVFGIGPRPASTTPISATTTAPTSAQPAPAATAPKVPPALGSPAPGDARDEESILLNRPLEANSHDFTRLVSKHGPVKALEMWSSNVNAYLRGVRLVPENKRSR